MIDPVMTGVVADRLWSILDEQQRTLVSTAFSSVVRESLDLACSVFDSSGEMVGQSVGGTPGHINAMATGMRHMAAEFPASVLDPGDVLVTNDPWMTAGQINDLTVATPVFRKGRLIAWFASCCHAADIGGRLLSAEAREVFEEGLRLPILKLASLDGIDPIVEAIIRSNVRTPDETIGDLHAQIAANRVAERGLMRLMDELDLEDLDGVAAEIMTRSETALRNALKAVPDGIATAETRADGFADEELVLRCRVAVAADEISIDFAGSSPQSSHGINVVFNYTRAYASFAIKAAIAPDVPHNAGSFRPVRVSAPLGSILNCLDPAPVAARHIVGHFIPSLVYDALGHLLPNRLLTYGSDALWLTVFTGHDQGGAPFVFNTFQAGGMGARATKDGLSTTGFPTGVQATPTEVIETLCPLVQRHRRLTVDSGGPGKYRGGLGQQTRVAVRAGAPWAVNANIDRLASPARGARGGGAGGLGHFGRADGTRLPSKTHIRLDPSAEVDIDLPGGGGYGEPAERDVEAVLMDVVDGYVSIEAAMNLYGVAITYMGEPDALVRLPHHYQVQLEQTHSMRSAMLGGD